MPGWIAEGMANGTLEAIGGVIRQVDGKQVVMWLRPGLEETIKTSAPLLGPLAGLSGGAALSLATTAGFGIAALAGFAVLKRQVNQVTAKLDTISAGQGRLQDGVTELLDDSFARARHAVETALETIAMEEERRAFDMLQQPIVVLRENSRYFATKMDGILRKQTALCYAPLFVEFAKLFVLTAQAKARALIRYQGLAMAEREIQSDQEKYAEMYQRFLRPLAAPEAHLEHFVLMTELQDFEMRRSLPQLPRPEAVNFLSSPGLPHDADMLRALLDLMIARAGEPTAGIIPASAAPEGWVPEPVLVQAAQQEARR